MDVELHRRISETTTSKGSDSTNDGSPLLQPANSDQAKRLKDEALTFMRDKHPKLVDVDAVDVLKVISSTICYLTRNAQQELTEISISIAFPQVILQCHYLTNLLNSLALPEDHGGQAFRYLNSEYSSVLSRLHQYFDWMLEYAWNIVFDNWKSKAKGGDWIDNKTSDLKSNLAEILLMTNSVKEAFRQIDEIAETSLFEITLKAQETFDMFEKGISDCTAKAEELRIKQAALPLAICSTMLCEMPESIPALDSNFYSTLSQCVSSFAGLYVIVKPILRKGEGGKIKTKFPKVFYTMLATSLLTSVASAVGYAWSPPSSIPLAYVSGLTLNIATLLIIQDSGNQIKEGFEETGRLAAEVNDLEAELGALRGRY
ncbi:uncharacterized protein FIESC28_02347 [Fusarium coffeatum]|uniref:Uncharacterized protein n=1 Tax=Fusarium coffeatum TaxID=231269 RepID=A0A366S692_9HYPO|nr:uncharacterized protein FIESC28_02347 [Fusarium coffeatum]RBR24857.1 hypothetical protein FIESC28_02347 [Fusarium coffeatum]